ncbi:hypothetical protein UFOVP558_15 [uncultured Caudovirales phage]|uniref:Uncharacterized protein n=1 Tax=uncultured Caudovirales phage TaxID=2100421 RepID=A0A6J5MXE8_9CAUD|nr:hypothetical protein UFOVP558_15 [uncultured Caudovirales phage]
MKVKLKMPRQLGGVDYKIGVHEMPDAVANDPYFLAQVSNGNALIVEEPAEKVKAPKAPKADKPEGDQKPNDPPAEKPSKASKGPKIPGESKYERAKRLKAEKKAKLEAEAAGTQEG